MLKDVFRKPTKYVTIKSVPAIQPRLPLEADPSEQKSAERKELPDNLWVKCPGCGEVHFTKNLEEYAQVCVKCSYHFRMNARQRVDLLLDAGSFQEWNADLVSVDPLEFPGYKEKIAQERQKTKMTEGVLTGLGSIEQMPVACLVSENAFFMGSMGSAIGEKIARAIERAIAMGIPVLSITSSGGARMQEGILSLYQMAKTSAALERLSEAGLLYLSVLTNPTYGGVTASYAMLGDVIIAEPGALIGFTGPNIIKQTIGKELPLGAQTAEFNQAHGFVDLIVDRTQLRHMLEKLLRYHRREA
ncbi:MAG: acetyl-CoA carboxylase, carboxyltransferase subunit beta [Peptococcaceae bacterium]|jgi:acetyl-CoA carboxylase carboxyl transferase subunit beta|nr:acetyl-CoA carboxylase, carboxyltransferase subunit beta [Peptococcaceae bacterium]